MDEIDYNMYDSKKSPHDTRRKPGDPSLLSYSPRADHQFLLMIRLAMTISTTGRLREFKC